MQFKKSAVFEVLIMLYLSTDSWCYYIPERKASTSEKKNATSPHPEKIQICGNALTNFIIEACDGIVGSFSTANIKRNSVQTKITEDCCDQECPLDYLQTYCGEAPLLTTKKTLRGKLLGKLMKTRTPGSATAGGTPDEGQKKGVSEVSVVEKRRRAKSRRKRKKTFKWKCAYKSFGHYLLRLDRRGRARHNKVQGSNSMNRRWPSIEIGTISPEMEKFGGQPIIVVRKNKPNSS